MNAIKHIKIYTKSLAINGVQIKTSMRLKKIFLKKLVIPGANESVKWYNHFRKHFNNFF